MSVPTNRKPETSFLNVSWRHQLLTATTRDGSFVEDGRPDLLRLRRCSADDLGLELASDIDLGFMRWLTVRVPTRRVPPPSPVKPNLTVESRIQTRR